MISGPYQSGLPRTDNPLLTSPYGTGRRSLAQSPGPAESTAFRRVDLSTRPAASGEQGQAPSAPAPSDPSRSQRLAEDARHRPSPQGTAQGRGQDRPESSRTHPSDGDEVAAGAAHSRTPPPAAPPVRDADGNGLPHPVTAGRTALLSGRAGIMAQLFGQDPTRSQQPHPDPRGRTPAAATSRETAAHPPLSRLEINVAITTYRGANDAVGGPAATATATETGGGIGVEILVDMAPARSTGLDAVA